MPLELHANDNAREAKPSLWIFHGPAVGWFVLGVMFFVSLVTFLARLGADWLSATVISLLPLGAVTMFVQFFVNGRPPSHALDLLALQVWRLRSAWYVQRLSDRPPQFWVVLRSPRYPKEFS
jgi:hypothetical protein